MTCSLPIMAALTGAIGSISVIRQATSDRLMRRRFRVFIIGSILFWKTTVEKNGFLSGTNVLRSERALLLAQLNTLKKQPVSNTRTNRCHATGAGIFFVRSSTISVMWV